MSFPYLMGFSAQGSRFPHPCKFEFRPDLGSDFRMVILTGPSGSGKTSALLALHNELSHMLNNVPTPWEESEKYLDFIATTKAKLLNKNLSQQDRILFEGHVAQWQEAIDKLRRSPMAQMRMASKTDLRKRMADRACLYCYISAKRSTTVDSAVGPAKLENIHQRQIESLSRHFQQFMVNKRAEWLAAEARKDEATAKSLGDWFDSFRNVLRLTFSDPGLALRFGSTNIEFNLKFGNGREANLNELSDGQGAVISILAEILIRLDHLRAENPAFDGSGFVLIDGLEMHVHADLQITLLPLLHGLFPRLQFIVSSHVPEAVNGVRGAAICELGTSRPLALFAREEFGISTTLSDETAGQLTRVQKLMAKQQIEGQEAAELANLIQDLEGLSNSVVHQVQSAMKKAQ